MTNIKSLTNKLSELYEEYKDDEYIINKLSNHINNELPTLLINTKKLQLSRENRRTLLTEGHDKFVSEFVNRNIYFYCSTTEIFFKYNNNFYNIIKEDDIIHDILSTLSSRDNKEQEYYEQQLLPWKFKIKISSIKQIRESSLFTSIPESITIQNVINVFYETFFNSRNEVKYFLTILGDHILKKQNNNIYLISPSAKTLIRLLENQGGKYFGHIPLQTAFRYKYHDHVYKDCRLVNIKNISNVEEILEGIVGNGTNNAQIIDIFVVCCYYSNRYETADGYLDADKYADSSQDNNLTDYALYLKNNTPETLIQKFINSKIQQSTGPTISMKNMLYLWKCYLDENNVSGILFTANFKTIVKTLLEFNDLEECFTGYTSLGLPLVSKFVKFWDSSMKENVDEYFIEIDEICIIFKLWLGGKSTLEIKDYIILNLIKHFYPDIVIDNNKFIYGISCSAWSKKDELKDFLNSHDNAYELTTYELYVEYTKKNKKNMGALTVNKSYFDLFMACKGKPLTNPL